MPKRHTPWFPFLLATTWMVLTATAMRDMAAFVAATQTPKPAVERAEMKRSLPSTSARPARGPRRG